MDVDSHKQREITRLCIQCALFLLQHGAESMLVEQLSSRLGVALGAESVESSISANAVVLTTIIGGHCMTSTRKNVDRGINMHVVTEVQHIVIMAEHHLLDIKDVHRRFEHIKPLRYPRWLLVAGFNGWTVLCLFLQTQRWRLGWIFGGIYCQRRGDVCEAGTHSASNAPAD